jgi:hypothetical protein
MKFQIGIIIGLIILLAIGAFWADQKINNLQEQLIEAQGVKPDTVEVVVELTDTVVVHEADSTIHDIDTVQVDDTTFIHHYPTLIDYDEQPLFALRVKVDTRAEEFTYKYNYKPLTLHLEFYDKYNLKKGFKVYSTPSVGNIDVNWGSYEPIKKKKFRLEGGIGYSKREGPFLLTSIGWERNSIGLFLVEGSWGIFYKRVLYSF